MRNRIIVVLVGIFLVVVLALGSLGVALALAHRGDSLLSQQQSQAAPAVGVTHVFIRAHSGDVYDPGTIQVVHGTVVTWTNQDTDMHSVVLSYDVTATSDLWTSGAITTGQSASYTFTTPGRYVYHCSLHPSMIGIVIVT